MLKSVLKMCYQSEQNKSRKLTARLVEAQEKIDELLLANNLLRDELNDISAELEKTKREAERWRGISYDIDAARKRGRAGNA